jgi:hypothetical protein
MALFAHRVRRRLEADRPIPFVPFVTQTGTTVPAHDHLVGYRCADARSKHDAIIAGMGRGVPNFAERGRRDPPSAGG